MTYHSECRARTGDLSCRRTSASASACPRAANFCWKRPLTGLVLRTVAQAVAHAQAIAPSLSGGQTGRLG